MGNKEKRRHKSRSVSRERRKDVSYHGKKSYRYDGTDKARVKTRYGLARMMSLVFAMSLLTSRRYQCVNMALRLYTEIQTSRNIIMLILDSSFIEALFCYRVNANKQ